MSQMTAKMKIASFFFRRHSSLSLIEHIFNRKPTMEEDFDLKTDTLISIMVAM